MKTLQKFYEEVKVSDELKKEFAQAVRADKITDFLKAHDCDATADDLREFLAGKTAQNKKLKLDDDELDLAAGGTGYSMVTCDKGCSDGCTKC